MVFLKMHGGIAVKEDQGDQENKLNSFGSPINRGVELLLRQRREKSEEPKTFQIKFGKMISLLRREFVIHLNFYLDIRKK